MANEDLGTLRYGIEVDTKGVDKGQEAMDGLQKSADETSKKVDGAEKSIDKVGKTSTKSAKEVNRLDKATTDVGISMRDAVTAAGAFAASLTTIAALSAESAKEIQNMARLSGTSVEEFQKLAFGANEAGISAEKLGDIYKDVQDKIGDFIATGGGELKDYFENVAPLVGQTAEQFQGLSGPQALGLFQKGLEDANLSASQQIFYLESLANDAALLQPLLANNAQGFSEAGRRAGELNVVLSQFQIDQLVEVNKAFNELSTTISRGTQSIVADNAEDIIDAIQSVSEAIASATEFLEENMDVIKSAATILGSAAVAYGTYRTAVLLATTATKAFNVAVKSNPLGLLITAGGAAVGIMSEFADESDSAATSVERLTKNIESMTEAQRANAAEKLRQKVIEKQLELNEALEEQNRIISDTNPSMSGGGLLSGVATSAELLPATTKVDAIKASIGRLEEAIKKLGSSGEDSFNGLQKEFDTFLSRVDFAAQKIDRSIDDDTFFAYTEYSEAMAEAMKNGAKKGSDEGLKAVPSDFAMSVGNALASQDYSSFANILASQAAGSIGTAVTDAVGGSLGGVAGGLVGGAAGAVISQAISDFMADDLIALERQASQGTGTVLGSIDAKSQSIANSLDYMSEGLDDLIGVNTDGFKAIQALSDSLAGASNLIARDFDTSGITGSLGLSGLGSITQDFGGIVDDFFGGLTGGLFEDVFGGIGGALFGSSSVSDQGINLLSGTIAELIENDVTQAYQTVTKKSLFSSSRKTSYEFAGDAIEQQFDLTLEAMRDAVTTSAESLGMLPSEIQANLDAFTIEAQKISIKDLSAEEVADELEAVFSSIFDNLSSAVVPYVDDFQQAGEGAGETLSRLSTNLSVVDEMLAQLRLGELQGTTQEMLTLSEGVVDFFGDASSLASAFTGFVDEFATQERQLEILTGNLTEALGDQDVAILNSRDGVYDYIASLEQLDGDNVERIANILSLTDSIDEYFDLLGAVNESTADYTDLQIRLAEAQDNDALATRLTREKEYSEAVDDTARGLLTAIYAAEDYADVLSDVSEIMNERLSDAKSTTNSVFNSLKNALDLMKEGIQDRYEIEKDLIQDSLDATRESVSELESVADSLKDAIDSTVDISTAAARAQLLSARNQLSALADSGVIPDSDVLDKLLSTVTRDNAQYYANSIDYYREQGRTANDISDLSELADEQLTSAERSVIAQESALETLQKQYDLDISAVNDQISYWTDQLDISRGTYDAVMSVEEAIKALNLSIGNEQQAQSDVDKIDSSTGNGGASSGGVTAGVSNQEIQDYIQYALMQSTVNGVTDYDAAEKLIGLNAIKYGVSSERLAAVMGITQEEVLAAAERHGLPAFANGGTHMGGLALVGERGPEIVNMPAGTHVSTAGQTASMLNNNRMIELMQEMIDRTIVQNGYAKRSYDILNRVSNGGNAFSTDTVVVASV